MLIKENNELLELYEFQLKCYLGINNTSLEKTKAIEIYESMIYTLSLLKEEELFNQDLRLSLKQGQKELIEKIEICKKKYKLILFTLPLHTNVYYDETIKNLKSFFFQYDIYYRAHDLPCSIDYWLLNHVNEKKKGISYFEEYVNRLYLENRFIQFFNEKQIQSLYDKYTLNPREDFYNLCIPILYNAIGHLLLQQDYQSLSINHMQREQLYHLLKNNSISLLKQKVNRAIKQICLDIGLSHQDEIHYFQKTTNTFASLIYHSLRNHHLHLLFLDFHYNEIIDN